MEPLDPCPTAEDIFRWVAGHLKGTPRHATIGLHVAGCPDLCGEYVEASMVAIQAVVEGVPTPPAGKSESRKSLSELVHEAKHREQDAARVFQGEPGSWWETLAGHPEREDPGFLFYVADKAVYYADERPRDVLAFVARFRAALQAVPAGDDRHVVEALLGLAEGVALRTEGDHVRALEAYARAESALPNPAYDVEHPRINLARGASLRRLGRYDEARQVLELAQSGFERLGISGASKALWQLANIAYETGDPRETFHIAHRAHRMLKAEGNYAEAAIMRQVLAAALLALSRPRVARRILDALAQDPHIARNPYERTRLLWNRAHLLAVENDLQAAMDLIERVSEGFAAAEVPLDAARAQLDLAHLAGRSGDPARQAAAAAAAAAILDTVAGQVPEHAAAVAELRQALGGGAAVGAAVVSLRDRLRRI